jgi:hypothetical protein
VTYGPPKVVISWTGQVTQLQVFRPSQSLLTYTLSARLTQFPNGAPVAGQTVTLIGPVGACSPVTTASGVATCTLFGLALPGIYTANYTTNRYYLSSSDIKLF